MREAKLVNSKSYKSQETSAQQMPTERTTTSPDQTPTLPTEAYQPNFEDIKLYLSSEEVKYLENIVDSYWKAYR